MSENSNHLKSFVERLAKSQSSPSVKEDVIDGRLSPEFSPGPLDGSPEVEAKRSSIHQLLVEDSPNGSNHELQSGQWSNVTRQNVKLNYIPIIFFVPPKKQMQNKRLVNIDLEE